MNEVLAFLRDCKVFFVATTEGDLPRVRPFGFVMEHEGKLYFVTGNQKPFFQQIHENPNVEICGLNEKSEWVRLSGKAVLDSRLEVKQKAFEMEPLLAYVYQTVENPIFECFYLDEAEASFCTMTAPERRIKL